MIKNAREVIREGMAPYLEPGETIQQAFGAQTGPSPYWAFLTWLVLAFGAKFRTVVVTDRGILVGRSSFFRPFKPKEFVGRLPRNQQLGPAKGLWYSTQLGPDKVHVHRRFQDDLRQADAAIGITW